MNVLITGGSRGLGLEVAQQQVESGNNVYLISRTHTASVDELLSKKPDRVRHLQFDLLQTDLIKQGVFANWIGQDVPIHALVCNAAIAYDDLATNAKLLSINEMFQVNIIAPMMLTKCAIRNMLYHRTAGSVVFVSSICAHKGYKGLSMYAATKGALEAYSKGIAREWGSKGIRSNCVVPGFLETEMSAKIDKLQRARIFDRNSLRKPATLKSVASAICYLVSPSSESITGQEIVVDAGSI